MEVTLGPHASDMKDLYTFNGKIASNLHFHACTFFWAKTNSHRIIIYLSWNFFYYLLWQRKIYYSRNKHKIKMYYIY